LITDDWKIKPASTSTIRSLIHKFSSDAVFHGFEEVEVCVSWKDVNTSPSLFLSCIF
jgi:hypothetical protein